MTPEAQRIAIAEACGWKSCAGDSGFVTRYKGTTSETTVRVKLPDYPNDLNAIHDAVKSLPQNIMPRYFACLCNVVSGALSLYGYSRATEATAAQRCEAFLRTINKWKNDN